ncbi:hypothetical protein G7072_13160 [Nocardioides sp. HDW12B]|uniref:hypothetical protein n=1 Tax=Nocardioides sp. HDW12B TaxID=2714939 RepID=UPI00140AE2B1|nr:hypothetical protein [Nocardioides sp. HDW12B]QIK67164.1 hypothetical protein G7072_13160 [Nocardioides sp. HDW12B]
MVRLVLLGAWLVVLAAAVLLAERPSSWDRLEGAVARGDVGSVVLRGDLALEGRGWSVTDVAWREGPFAHHAEVLVARPREAGLRQVRRGSFPEATLVTSQDVSTLLADLDPDLRVETAPWSGSGATFEAFPGWRLKGWVVGLAFGTFVATVVLLVLGPPTRRATPWAWFWLLTTPFLPLVAVALLVLGYRTPFLPPGRDGRRGLTGGWAFLLSLVLGAAATR